MISVTEEPLPLICLMYDLKTLALSQDKYCYIIPVTIYSNIITMHVICI